MSFSSSSSSSSSSLYFWLSVTFRTKASISIVSGSVSTYLSMLMLSSALQLLKAASTLAVTSPVENHAFSKHLVTVSGNNFFTAWLIQITPSRTETVLASSEPDDVQSILASKDCINNLRQWTLTFRMMPWSIGWETLVVFRGNQASRTLENLIGGGMLRYPRTTKHVGFAFSFCHWKPLTIPPRSETSSMPFCWISAQREVSVCPVFGSIVALLPCR